MAVGSVEGRGSRGQGERLEENSSMLTPVSRTGGKEGGRERWQDGRTGRRGSWSKFRSRFCGGRIGKVLRRE